MKKNLMALAFVGIMLFAILLIIGIFAILNNNKKIGNQSSFYVEMNYSEGFGDGSSSYQITISNNGSVELIYTKSDKRMTSKIDQNEINYLKKIINDNASDVNFSNDERLDYGSYNINVYEDNKEIYSFGDSWNKSGNSHFNIIRDEIIKIKNENF